MAIEPTLIWEKLVESHPGFLLCDQVAMFYDEKISLSKVVDAINRRKKSHFHIEFDQATIHYSPIGNNELSFLGIEKCVADTKDAASWVNPFLIFDSFIHARVYDIEYEYWQNALDPLQYEAVGRSYSHLPMKSNELPFPLEKTIIDISSNPGRRVLRAGYIEAVGSIMWLGKEFWRLTNAKQKNLCRQDWIACDELCTNVILIKAADTPFVIDQGEELDLQNKLRELLFPTC
jgi:hypothetical protein